VTEGRVSRLELTFRARSGQTHLAAQFVDSPLKVLRPFALGDGRVLLQLLNVGPGMMAGDSFKITIRVEQGAKVVLVNPSATKLHTMPQGSARQTLSLHVEAGAELEYYPGLIIPYRETEFYQTTEVELQQGGRFGLLERWSMGRVAHGEAFSFRRLSSRLQLRQEDTLLYADALELTPATASHLGSLDGHTHLALGLWLWDDEAYAEKLTRHIVKPALNATSLVEGSFGAGRYLRCLGSDGLEHAQQVSDVVKRWRKLSGLPPLAFHRFGDIGAAPEKPE